MAWRSPLIPVGHGLLDAALNPRLGAVAAQSKKLVVRYVLRRYGTPHECLLVLFKLAASQPGLLVVDVGKVLLGEDTRAGTQHARPSTVPARQESAAASSPC